VVKATTGEQLWETCDFTLDRFSPDGRYVIGLDAYLDGIGGTTVAILDASDGDVLAEFTTRDLGFTGPAAWESDGTVLVSTFQDGTWYLLRLRPDGTVEQALDPVEGNEMRRPWDLAVTP
jgi:WD40 repeat protein